MQLLIRLFLLHLLHLTHSRARQGTLALQRLSLKCLPTIHGHGETVIDHHVLPVQLVRMLLLVNQLVNLVLLVHIRLQPQQRVNLVLLIPTVIKALPLAHLVPLALP